MKIVDVRSYTLKSPLGDQGFYASQESFSERSSCLVRIETDTGLVGWGEGGLWGAPEPVAAMIDHVLTPRIIGQNPLHMDVIWERLYAHIRDWGRQGTAVEAISGVDIACWDIAGQALQQPIHALLGGAYRDRVLSYATGGYYKGGPEQWPDTGLLKAEVARHLDNGFRALKIKVGLLSVAEDLARVKAARQVLDDCAPSGTRFPYMVDANHAYPPHIAITVGRGLEEEGVLWFEEPVIPEDRKGYRQVAETLDVAIAAGECEHTRYQFPRPHPGWVHRHRTAGYLRHRRHFRGGEDRHPRAHLWRAGDPARLGFRYRAGRRAAFYCFAAAQPTLGKSLAGPQRADAGVRPQSQPFARHAAARSHCP